ncbi:MAG: NAD(P)H-dependent oxidoreductase [Leptolyngbya sp. SIO4C1]|nr:NAD(P)H-dependent oxidoreductase [Leptolyngbya sp. SIO4C1]
MIDAQVSMPEYLLQQLNWRYATKQFDPDQQISEALWTRLEHSLVLSPSSFGLQPWKFFVVRDPQLRQQFQQYAWDQSQVVEASHLVVFAYKRGINASDVDRYIQRVASVRQTPIEDLQGFSDMIKGYIDRVSDIDAWSARQTYIALGMFLSAAAMLGIDACPMEGFDPDKVDQALGLPEQGYASVALCAAGYRSEEDKYADLAKVRFPAEQVIEYVG